MTGYASSSTMRGYDIRQPLSLIWAGRATTVPMPISPHSALPVTSGEPCSRGSMPPKRQTQQHDENGRAVRAGVDIGGTKTHAVTIDSGGQPVQQFRLPLSLIHISEPTRLGMISYAVF